MLFIWIQAIIFTSRNSWRGAWCSLEAAIHLFSITPYPIRVTAILSLSREAYSTFWTGCQSHTDAHACTYSPQMNHSTFNTGKRYPTIKLKVLLHLVYDYMASLKNKHYVHFLCNLEMLLWPSVCIMHKFGLIVYYTDWFIQCPFYLFGLALQRQTVHFSSSSPLKGTPV